MNKIESGNQSLRISEIFYSLQGETTLSGIPTVFIRLTGCPLRCQYCDTAYAFSGGKMQSFADIMQQVSRYQTQHVTVTGGEPLAQVNCLPLLNLLCDHGYTVSLETSGAMSVADVDTRVLKILDVKTPASNESEKNDWQNFRYLNADDQVKFVICDQADYRWAKQVLERYQLKGPQILFSPSHQQLSATELADWILEDQLLVRMQVQLHKYLWGDVPGK